MIDPADALARILSDLPELGRETVSLAEAVGRVTADPLVARLSNPPAEVSSMDGYAVRSADARDGSVLRIIGEAPAGHPSTAVVGEGDCVRLFTGSVIPDGADAVLIQENTERPAEGTLAGGSGAIVVRVPVPVGANIRRAGQDFQAGTILIPAGRALSARDIGVAAAANCPWITVRRRPRVAILSTGDELALPGESVRPGGIIGSVAPMLAALLRQAGGDPVMVPLIRDSVEDIERAVRGLDATDFLLTVGGASVGDYDLVKEGLARAGLRTEFWKIAMRPGKPLSFGRLGRTPVLGLPGNPVAAFVCSIVFALPALRAMAGVHPATREPEMARLAVPLAANDMRFDHLRATLTRDVDGVLWAHPFEKQDSGMMAPLAMADALVLRDAHAPAAAVGDVCRVLRFGARDD